MAPLFRRVHPIPVIRIALLVHATSAVVLISSIIVHVYAALWVKGTVARGAPVPAAAMSRALAGSAEHQRLHQLTGAVHGVAWVDRTGTSQAIREDVGRHNALDKLIGWMARTGTDNADGFVLTSSRANFEMVQKATAVGIGCLVAISAPTALAVRLAEGCGPTLAGFARGQRLVVYSHPSHLVA